MNQPWICPRCKIVNGPHTLACLRCAPSASAVRPDQIPPPTAAPMPAIYPPNVGITPWGEGHVTVPPDPATFVRN